MNFDVNLLSNLMQMFASRSQTNAGGGIQNYPPTNGGVNTQSNGGYNNQNSQQNRCANGPNNTYSSPDYASSGKQNDTYRESGGKQAYKTTSFAIENGIGENVRFEQPKANKETPSPNPMLSLLQMMQGGAPTQNGDAMSSMLPLLMNLLKNTSPQSNNKNVNDNTNKDKLVNDNTDKSSEAMNADVNQNPSGQTEGRANALNPNMNVSTKDMPSNTNHTNTQNARIDKDSAENSNTQNKKTQPSFFKPIAFAGYELMSALYRLYLTSALHRDR